MKKPKDTVVSQVELARLLGLSVQAIANHASAGVLVRAGRGRYDKDASVTSYCAHLRKAASGRNTQTSAERARLVSAQADAAEVKVKKLSGELVSAAEVETRWTSILRTVRSGCLALPTRIAAQIAHLTTHDIAVIDAEVRAVLTELGDPDVKSSRQD
jgi:phage terminase Nu1 subunit (DNA packaging protein)